MDPSLHVPVRSEDVVLSGGAGNPHTFTLKNVTCLYVGTGGTVIAKLAGDSAYRTYKNVPSGKELLGVFVAVKSTADGTTAADIVGQTGYPSDTF